MFAEGFFKTTFGFAEGPYLETQKLFLQHARFLPCTAATGAGPAVRDPHAERCTLADLPNGRTLDCGWFSTPSVVELRAMVRAAVADPTVQTHLAHLLASGRLPPRVQVSNVQGDSFGMHCQTSLRGAVFQAASQFNYLEFPGPNVVPENGINNYMFDRTQGPACAMACGAGTAYRNYMTLPPLGAADREGLRGQSKDCQLNGLADITSALMAATGTANEAFYKVRNGYVDSTNERLEQLNAFLVGPEAEKVALVEDLTGRLRIGVQEAAEVTAPAAGRTKRRQSDGTWQLVLDDPEQPALRVTQTYNSALSVAYSRASEAHWAPLASIVLNGTYEASLLVSVLLTVRAIQEDAAAPPAAAGGVNSPLVAPVLFTKVGGGVFGNRREWIADAIRRAVRSVQALGVPVDVRIVHYQGVEDGYGELTAELSSSQ